MPASPLLPQKHRSIVSMPHEIPTVVDLFAGAGGFSCGFEVAGFEVPVALEVDAWACDTLRHNRPGTRVLQTDIRDFKYQSTIKGATLFKPDLLIGGPPCQGFSIAGPAIKDPTDPRNSLFTNFAQWIEALQPSAFVMENVKGLLSRRNSEGESVIDIIKQTFSELGYFVEVWLLNAAEYGVPQTRERIFIVGHHQASAIGEPDKISRLPDTEQQEEHPALFQSTLCPSPTLWEAISDLPELGGGEGMEEQGYRIVPLTPYQEWAREGSEMLFNHVAMSHSKRLVARFEHIRCGESSADVPEEHGARSRNGQGALSGTKYDQNNRRLHPHKPSHTIAASFYANFVHPFQHRNLTAREGARLQSFPDRYKFQGKKTVVSHKLLQREERLSEKFLCQYNQIGNAVPPLLARAVALHLRKKLGL